MIPLSDKLSLMGLALLFIGAAMIFAAYYIPARATLPPGIILIGFGLVACFMSFFFGSRGR